MKTWKLIAPEKLIMEETQPTALCEDKVKVKVEEVLLGTTDIELITGEVKANLPLIPGRNAVGVISDVFDKEKSLFQKMDRVAIEPYMPCEACAECLRGEMHKCSDMRYFGQDGDGLLKNFVDVSIDQVYRLPDNLSNEKALFTSYVAFCLNIVDELQIEKGRHVAIFASTKTGIILAQLIAYYQAVPVLISNNGQLLDVAQSLGIFYCVNSSEVDVEDEIKTITGGRMCKELVLFTDSEYSMKDMYNAAAVNATICLAGYSNKDSRLSISQICQKHLSIFCVYNGVGNFSSAINLLVTGTVKVDNLVGDTVSFDTLDKQLADAKSEDFALKSTVVKVD